MTIVCMDLRASPPTIELAGDARPLTPADVASVALWLARVAGRHAVDAFEVAAINAKAIRLRPCDADGLPRHDEVRALEILRRDAGPLIGWEPREECMTCEGRGLEEGDDPEPCLSCDGQGSTWGSEFLTDMDGQPVPWGEHG